MGVKQQKADFSGYATKAGLRCSDGRTIMPGAFEHQDKAQVPLVWQHGHDDPANVLGHAILEHRDDGVYCRGFFNDTPQAKNAKELVQHDDIKSLSIYANQLKEQASNVLHGVIREVSLVLSGANPGALIDNVEIAHADGSTVELTDEAIIFTGEPLQHDAVSEEEAEEVVVEHAEDEGPTVQEVVDSMTEEQRQVLNFMVGAAAEGAGNDAQHSDDDESELSHTETEGKVSMTRNVFEQSKDSQEEKPTLSHSDLREIVKAAERGGSLKAAMDDYALAHGIDNIDILFPDARALDSTPEFDKRRMEWVSGVLNGTRHAPFSRIKSIVADITHAEARAKGYITGTLKKEEFFGLVKRVTTPATIYKKQKLERDDIIDITDFDVVAWLKAEMRMMLDEEIARAILIGDGRAVDDDDKIKDPAGATEGSGIRSILLDDDLYAATVTVDIADANSSYLEVVEGILRNMKFYKGSGSPTFYTTLDVVTGMLLTKDTQGRRYWNSQSELAMALGVGSIVTVEVIEDEPTILGIIVNLKDYTLGTDKGGDVAFFDDFDIDYNNYKYLIETRLSGALTKIRSALVVRKTASDLNLVVPNALAFDGEVIAHVAQTGVVYKKASDGSTISADITLTTGQSVTVVATPAAGYFFENNVEDEWTYVYEA